MTSVTWSRAWRVAAREFWSRERPGGHFSTSVGPLVAERIAGLVLEVDDRLGRPASFDIIDIGCGDGTLLSEVRERCADLSGRARWIGIDLRPVTADAVRSVMAEAPAHLPGTPIRGLVMAHEWLDEIPCDVVERDSEGVDRLVLVAQDGTEVLGPSLLEDEACAVHGVDASQARSWIERWWPLRESGDRAEVGVPRDQAWRWMSGLVAAGTALATDYGHWRSQRDEQHRHGTLVGYRGGRLTTPVPDGTANLTAHVALDACASALPGTVITTQRDEIECFPLGESPSAADLERHFAAIRLRDRTRLGAVSWLRWDA